MSKPIVADLTEEQIAQLNNDMSEDIASGNVREWRAVAKYWRDQYDSLHIKLWSERQRVLSLGLTLMNDRT